MAAEELLELELKFGGTAPSTDTYAGQHVYYLRVVLMWPYKIVSYRWAKIRNFSGRVFYTTRLVRGS